MSSKALQNKLITIVEPVCNAAGFDLVELRFLLEQGGWTLRISIDTPLSEHGDITQVPEDRVDLTDCADISRELSAVLDVDDPIKQAYSLEVGSPGIDRALRTPEHYAHFIGAEAKIHLAVGLPTPNGPRNNFRGALRAMTDDNKTVVIDCDGETFSLPLEDIETAKLVPDWDAVMAGKSGVGPASSRGQGRSGNKPIKPGHRPSAKPRKNKQQTKEQG